MRPGTGMPQGRWPQRPNSEDGRLPTLRGLVAALVALAALELGVVLAGRAGLLPGATAKGAALTAVVLVVVLLLLWPARSRET